MPNSSDGEPHGAGQPAQKLTGHRGSCDRGLAARTCGLRKATLAGFLGTHGVRAIPVSLYSPSHQGSLTAVPGGACCARLMRSASSGGRRALSLRRMSSPLGRKTISLTASTASEPSNKTAMPASKVFVPRCEFGAIGDQPITVSPRASIDLMTADLVARNEEASGSALDEQRRSVWGS